MKEVTNIMYRACFWDMEEDYDQDKEEYKLGLKKPSELDEALWSQKWVDAM